MEAVVINGLPAWGTALPLGAPRFTLPRTGLDTCVQEFLVNAGDISQLTNALNAALPIGRTHPELSTFWLEAVNPRDGEGAVWRVEGTFRGRLRDKPFVTSSSASTMQSTRENATISPPEPDYPFTYPSGGLRAQSNEGGPIWKVEYLLSTEAPLSVVSSTFQTIDSLKSGYPDPPDAPASRWTSLPNATWTYPAGWVLDNRERDSVYNQAGEVVMQAVTDSWQWYHQKRP
jgi:hypothetical protein